MEKQEKAFFTGDSNNLGTGDILVALLPIWIMVFIAIVSLISSLFSCDSPKSPSHNTPQSPPHVTTQPVEQNSSTWMDDNDPIKWRKEEEKLENQSEFRNAKYTCRRCGMKSHYPLNDGVNGTGGVCAYCINYLIQKSK